MLPGMPRSLARLQDDIAANTRLLRKRANLSQEGLALAAEVDRTYVSQIERGLGNPSIAVLERLAGVLRVDVSDLLKKRAR